MIAITAIIKKILKFESSSLIRHSYRKFLLKRSLPLFYKKLTKSAGIWYYSGIRKILCELSQENLAEDQLEGSTGPKILVRQLTRLKKSLFNILGSYYDGGVMLDMYSGSRPLPSRPISWDERAFLFENNRLAQRRLSKILRLQNHPSNFI